MKYFKPHKKILLSICAIIIFVIAGFVIFNKTKETKAAWWNESWQFRQSIQVTNNIGTQNNVYISVTLNTNTASTSMQTDCGDFRFTRENGELLPYYIVSGCRTTTNVIHINFPIFDAGLQAIYFYYGNPSAENGFAASDFAIEASNYTIGAISTAETGPGPVGYWSFDEGYGTTAHDETANRNDGTISGTTWKPESECVVGKCLQFDGINDKVTISATTPIVNTVVFWVKATTTTADFFKLNDVARISASNGIVSAPGFGSPTIYVDGTVKSDITANAWHMIAITTATAINATSTIISFSNNQYFGGYIDEIKFYPYARSADQIKQDYAAGLAGVKTPGSGVSTTFGSASDKWLSDGLVGYWKMDETATTSGALDSSGNSNTGAFISTASTTGGKFGNGGIFASSSNDYINVPDKASLNPSQVTLSAWVKSDFAGGYIIAKDPPDSDKGQIQPKKEEIEIAGQTGTTEKIKTYASDHKNILIMVFFFYLSLLLLGIYKTKRKEIGDNLVVCALALSGAAALIYEVASTQALTYFFNSSSYSVATAIVSFLLGLALGSFIVSKRLPNIKHPIRLLIVMQISAGIYALFVLPQYYQIVSVLSFFYDFAPDSAFILLALKFFIGTIFLLFPTIMLGASFPLASALVIKDIKTAGGAVGRLYSWDLIGAVFGALVSGFILLPKFGLTIAFATGAVLNMLAGLLLCDIKKKKMLLALTGLAIFIPLIVFGIGNRSLAPLASVSSPLETEPLLEKDVLFRKESAFGEILVTNKNEQPALAISKIVQCSTNYPPLLKNLEKVLAVMSAKEKALDVGLGCGYSANAIASSSKINHLDIVEINPVLTNTLKYFDNDSLLSNEKVVLNNDDIMHYLARTQNTYDFVNVELNMPSLTQVSPFYSEEYFQLLKQKISPDGTIRLWVCCGNYEFVKAVYKTLDKVYQDIIIKTDMDEREGKDYFYNTEFIIGGQAKTFEQNAAEKKLQKRIEGDKHFKISTLDNQLIGQIWYDWSQKNYKDYFIQPERITESEKPIIKDSYLFPLDVKPGDTMDAGARVLDENGIESVKISFPHEKGEDWLNLELSEGTIYDGLWKGEWPVHDTIDTTYYSRLVVENKNEVTEEKVVEWSDFVPPPLFCSSVSISSPTFETTVGSSVSVTCTPDSTMCANYIQDDTGGSYTTTPADDTDIDCSGDVCSNGSVTELTRNITCEAPGIYNIRCQGEGEDYFYDYATLTCNPASGKSDVPYALSTINGGQFLIKSDSMDYVADAVTDINDGEWHHLLGTYDGSAMKLFVDGNLEDTNTDFSGDLPVVAGDLHIGADYEASPGNFFNGQLDEVRVYNRALVDAEVRRLYEWAPGPVMHLKMDEMSGTTTYDNSGYGNEGTLTNSPTWVNGKYGSAVQFDGDNDNILIDNGFDTVNHLTIAFWIKPDNITLDRYVTFDSDKKSVILGYQDNYFNIYDYPTGTAADTQISATQGVWQYIVFTADETNVRGYKNGQLIFNVAGTLATGATSYRLSAETGGFNGAIDDFRIYDYARTQKQIIEDMNGGGPAVNSPMIHLNFDEGYGTTAHNEGIGGAILNGTLVPGAGGGNASATMMWDMGGKFNKAIELDGVDDYVSLPDFAY